MWMNSVPRTAAKAALLACVMLVMTAAAAAAAAEPGGRQQADALFTAKDWAGAAGAYEAIVAKDPADPLAWYRLGLSRHQLKQYPQAAAAYEKADATGAAPRGTKYNLACVYALMGRKDDAFRVLQGMASAGFSGIAMLEADSDLSGLRTDPRWQELKTTIQSVSHPCGSDPKARQFDFWVGTWEVFTPDGQRAGSNTIERIADGCGVLENWTDMVGGSGKSINYFDAVDGLWHQDWVGSQGGIIHYTGGLESGAMKLAGEVRPRAGAVHKIRCTWTPQPDGRVRQMGESSQDDGKTWTVSYDFYYARKGER